MVRDPNGAWEATTTPLSPLGQKPLHLTAFPEDKVTTVEAEHMCVSLRAAGRGDRLTIHSFLNFEPHKYSCWQKST